MKIITLIGSTGFIGSHVKSFFQENGIFDIKIFDHRRSNIENFGEFGTIIYCAGYGDCSKNPINVLDANTVLLSELLSRASFEKMIYISSTRVYMGGGGACENSDLIVLNDDSRRLFNLTKLVSEELCNKTDKNVIVLRPSNVYGAAFNSPLFLPSIVKDALMKNVINMYVSKEYSKDYLNIKDLIKIIYQFCESEIFNGVFNVASGKNTSAWNIARVISSETGCYVNWLKENDDDIFPVNNIDKVKSLFNFEPSDVLDDLHDMISDFRRVLQ